MAIKERKITCKECHQRVSVWRGERGPLQEYCDVCREQRKRDNAALRAQAYRQRRRVGG